MNCVYTSAFRWCPVSLLYKLLGWSWICVTLDQVAGPLTEQWHKDTQVLLNAQRVHLSWGQIFSCWVCYHKNNSERLARILLTLRGERNVSVMRSEQAWKVTVEKKRRDPKSRLTGIPVGYVQHDVIKTFTVTFEYLSNAVQCIWCRQSNPDSVPSKGFSL